MELAENHEKATGENPDFGFSNERLGGFKTDSTSSVNGESQDANENAAGFEYNNGIQRETIEG